MMMDVSSGKATPSFAIWQPDPAPLEIIKRQLVHFYKADPEYGIGVATHLGLKVSDLPSAVAAE
jgi:hypothetical protein